MPAGVWMVKVGSCVLGDEEDGSGEKKKKKKKTHTAMANCVAETRAVFLEEYSCW